MNTHLLWAIFSIRNDSDSDVGGYECIYVCRIGVIIRLELQYRYTIRDYRIKIIVLKAIFFLVLNV